MCSVKRLKVEKELKVALEKLKQRKILLQNQGQKKKKYDQLNFTDLALLG